MVAIKNMEEMPENCVECPYGLYWGSISTCIILANDEIDIQENMLEGTRYEYCPLTNVERYKTGKWIRKPIRNEKGGCIGAEMICSYCKKDNEQDKKLAYCPNCGAEMRGAEDV